MIDPLNPRSLEQARKDAKLSRAELSAISNVHETTIMRIEKGEVDPRVDGTWAPIVRALQQCPSPQGAAA
ncbi:helix-turn-helix transcriptional regulator [Rhizorhabdus wittichii]|uniref:Helix-turn-helix transcriptional regulator n=1 Tax=Rhizorhabdus wittichii TaxID=160791 RepID=A0A975CZ22_9SPHN|nr:helix-turn-helix transcriptional regulator [Rhizorhabdus wittichii]QTH19639.1 helix-turn-helix transcriptional regulator [Rhizorhabdus wittichii]